MLQAPSLKPFRTPRRGGFTLIEILIIIAVVGIMLGLLLPAIQVARESSRRTQCRNNLRQIGVAAMSFHDSRQGLPPSYIGYRGNSKMAGQTWVWLILPWLDSVWASDVTDQSIWAAADNVCSDNKSAVVRSYFCPTRRPPMRQTTPSTAAPGVLCSTQTNPDSNRPGTCTDYAANGGTGTVGNQTLPGLVHQEFGPYSNGAIVPAEVTQVVTPSGGVGVPDGSWRFLWMPKTTITTLRDGAGVTILFGEKWVSDGGRGLQGGDATNDQNSFTNTTWFGDGDAFDARFESHFVRKGHHNLAASVTDSSIVQWNSYDFGSPHAGLVHFVFGDGAVHALKLGMDPVIYTRLLDRQDGGELDQTAFD